MNQGKLFENDFKASVPKDAVYYYRIKDSAGGWDNQESDIVRFTPKNEFDVILYKQPALFLLELKSTIGTSISFKGTTPMIKSHQIKELTKASSILGIKAGFIFNFRSKPCTYFLNIKDFNIFLNSTKKSSINQADILNHNGLVIDSEIKKVRYKYRVDLFLEYFISSSILN